jgi:hypothetical protein
MTEINSVEVRDIINNALKRHNISNILVATTSLFKTKNNVILIMIEINIVDQLIKHRVI